MTKTCFECEDDQESIVKFHLPALILYRLHIAHQVKQVPNSCQLPSKHTECDTYAYSRSH